VLFVFVASLQTALRVFLVGVFEVPLLQRAPRMDGLALIQLLQVGGIAFTSAAKAESQLEA
jgi:hypothetical protein